MCTFCGDRTGSESLLWGGLEVVYPADAELMAPLAGSVAVEESQPAPAAATVTSAFEQQVAYLTGVNADGTIQNNSWWGQRSDTAHKWGTPTAGTGATLSYTYDAASNLTDTEKDTFVTALDMWSAIANVTFVLGDSNADVKLQRGGSGSGANERGPSTLGSGSTIGQSSGQHIINMETGVVGWDLSGRVDFIGGFGMATIIHEVGHLLGLGHGGNYNGAVDPATQQFSAYDEKMWTTMSYIGFDLRNRAAFRNSYDYTDTNWGSDSDDIPGSWFPRAAHTWMPLDVVAIQRLYGEAESTPLDGGEVFGFNSNIGGRLQRFFDFTNNTTPVVTLFSTGTNNTLNLSGFSQASRVDLVDGAFSSAAGLVNNIGIAFGTVIESAITGSGADTLRGNAADNLFDGGAGADAFDGLGGSDTVTYERSDAGVDIDLGRQDTRPPSGGHAQGDTLVSIENLIGSQFDDRLVGVTGVGGNELEGLNGNDIIFGSADNDTIRGGLGNDQIYGNEGNDRLYGADSNLILNGGFEVIDSVKVEANGYVQYLDSLDGWGLLSGPGVELFTGAVAGADPFEGTYGIDLEGYAPGTNVGITQLVDRAADGASYRLAFEARKLDAATAARVEVYWGGTKLTWGPAHDTYIDPTTGYLTYYIDVIGGAGSGADKNRLSFVEIGGGDGNGTMLDNVRMYRAHAGIAKAADQDPWSDGSDTFVPGAGSDVVFGNGGDDRAIFNDINTESDHLDGGSGIDTLVLDWSLAATSIGYSALGVTNSDQIGTASSYYLANFGGSNQYLFFREVERFEVKGGSASDNLVGGVLDDILMGNDGDDYLIGGGGIDTLNGGGGFDRASLTLSALGNNIVLKNLMGSGSVTLADGTQLISIEAVSLTGGGGDDYLDVRGTVFNPSDNPYLNRTWTYFAGLGGNDTLAVDFATSYGVEFDGGEGASDLVIMDWSASLQDIFRDGSDGSYKSYSHSVTLISGGVPYTTEYFYTASIKNVERFDLAGGKGNDSLLGGALDDVLRSNGGRDVLSAASGTDLLVIDWSKIDRAVGTLDAVENNGLALTGTLTAGYSGAYFADDPHYYDRVDFAGVERFDIRTAGRNDVIRTGDGNDTVSGGAGNDHLITGQGIDNVDGGLDVDRWEADKSFATSVQAFNLDLTKAETQLVYLGTGTVRGIEALTLKTGAGNDTIKTVDTLLSLNDSHGYDDQIDTGAGSDAVTVTGGRDVVAMGSGTDTLTVDWSTIGRNIGTVDAVGSGGVVLTGTLATGYSGIFYGDDALYNNRVDFSGVEHFVIRTGNGHDGITTGDGNDTVSSGDGNDHLITGQGIDIVDGGGNSGDRWEADKSFANAKQHISIDLTLAGIQSTYLGAGTVRGIEALTLKTGAGKDKIKTVGTVLSLNDSHGYDDQIDTGAGSDAVTVTGGRDVVAMGSGTDTLTVDWSTIGRNIGTVDAVGSGGVVLTGTLATGYSGIFYGDDALYNNRVDFSGVEHFVIRTGNGHDGITTGDGNDTIESGDGNDTVLAGGGNDVLRGGLGADVLDGGIGVDTADYSDKTVSVSVTLNGATNSSVLVNGVVEDTIRNIENVTGGSGADTLTGDGLANSLNGGSGIDTLTGGNGNDTYTIETVDDLVVETNADAATGGIDTVLSSLAAYTLTTNVENLTLTGAASINGTGNTLNNVITGNGAANILTGGLGNDTITGGLGADIFRFASALNPATNVDRITDFTPTAVSTTTDRIQLENTGARLFTAITTTGTLAATAFVSGAVFTSAAQLIRYDGGTGNLFYDSDGNGSKASILFAILNPNLTTLNNTHFVVT